MLLDCGRAVFRALWMIWGTHVHTSGALGPGRDVAREALSPVSCCCHCGEGAEP